MSQPANGLRVATAAALMGSFACLGTVTAAADPSSPEVSTLAGSLSKGYSLDNCTSQDPPSGALAAIQCGQSPDSSGPALATYLLFANPADTTGSFKTSINGMTQTNCGDTESPTVWGRQQGTTAGQVACGTYQGVAEIIWTTDAKNVVSVIHSSNTDVPSLYQWWRIKG